MLWDAFPRRTACNDAFSYSFKSAAIEHLVRSSACASIDVRFAWQAQHFAMWDSLFREVGVEASFSVPGTAFGVIPCDRCAAK